MPLYVANVGYRVYFAVKKFSGYTRLGPKEVPLVLSGGAEKFGLGVSKGELECSVSCCTYDSYCKGSNEWLLVLFADLRDVGRSDEIDGVIESVKDSQREIEVLATRNRKVVLGRAHGSYTISY